MDTVANISKPFIRSSLRHRTRYWFLCSILLVIFHNLQMPNLSFDVFFDQDFINISASRGRNAPKAKPEWKVRTAPKLPPKPEVADSKGTARPPPRPTINSTRAPQRSAKTTEQKPTEEKGTTFSDAASQTSEARRKPPKLGPRKKPAPTQKPSTAKPSQS